MTLRFEKIAMNMMPFLEYFPADWFGSLSGRGGAWRGDRVTCIRDELGWYIGGDLPRELSAGGM